MLENEQLLKDIMTKASQVPIDVKPTCAPQFTRVAKQLGVDTRFERGCLAGLTSVSYTHLDVYKRQR